MSRLYIYFEVDEIQVMFLMPDLRLAFMRLFCVDESPAHLALTRDMSLPKMEEPQFRVFIRIPIPRPAGFADPPSFVWNAEKEAALWKVISRRTRGDINCKSSCSCELPFVNTL